MAFLYKYTVSVWGWGGGGARYHTSLRYLPLICRFFTKLSAFVESIDPWKQWQNTSKNPLQTGWDWCLLRFWGSHPNLFLSYGVDRSVNVSCHAFCVTTNIYIRSFRDHVPDFRSLQHTTKICQFKNLKAYAKIWLLSSLPCPSSCAVHILWLVLHERRPRLALRVHYSLETSGALPRRWSPANTRKS